MKENGKRLADYYPSKDAIGKIFVSPTIGPYIVNEFYKRTEDNKEFPFVSARILGVSRSKNFGLPLFGEHSHLDDIHLNLGREKKREVLEALEIILKASNS